MRSNPLICLAVTLPLVAWSVAAQAPVPVTPPQAPIPVTPLAPDSPAATLKVVEKTFDGDVAAQSWLNDTARDGFAVLSVVPLRRGTSLFVLEKAAPGSPPRHQVLAVNRPLGLGTVRDRVVQNSDKRFVGAHPLGASSFLMIFRYE